MTEQELSSWICKSEVAFLDQDFGIRLASGGGLYIRAVEDITEFSLSYEGDSQKILEHCLRGRSAWYLTYRGTAGSIRQAVAHVAYRWPLYVDTDHYEILTGAAFVRRLLEEPDWDLADTSSDNLSLIERFNF